MKKSKLLNLFLIVTMLSVWSLPELSLAVEIDWFGNKNKDQIIYLKGYNAAMSKIAANLEIPKPTKTGVQPQTVSTLTTTSSTAYVTNPMTADLDVGNFYIHGLSSSDGTVKINSDLRIQDRNGLYVPQIYMSNDYMEGEDILGVHAFAFRGDAGLFTTTGDEATAGKFEAEGDNSKAVHAYTKGANSYAGYFEGNVNTTGLLKASKLCVTGNLNDPGACFDDPAILGRAANVGVYGVALNGSAGTGIEGQGFHGVTGSATGNNGAGIYGKVVGGITDAYAGYFEGRVEIKNNMLIVNNPYEYVTGTPPYFSQPDSSIGIAVSGADWGIASFGMNTTRGAGVSGKGYHGLEGQAIFEGGAGLYASNSGLENTLAGYFDGRVEMVNGGLGIDHGSVKIESASNSQPALSARVLVEGATAINGVATTPNSLAGHFYGNVVVDAGKVGIGTVTPNKQLHIYSQDVNAEIDIQSGSNTHWGIYQDKTSGNLNFWHGENKVTFSDNGLSAKGFCLEKVCIDSWKDLKAILDQTDPVPATGNRVPTQQ